MVNRNLETYAGVTQGLVAGNNASEKFTSSIDLADWLEVAFIVNVTSITTGPIVLAVQSSADDTTFADVTGETVTLTTTAPVTPQAFMLNVHAREFGARYCRLRTTPTAGSWVGGVSILGIRPAGDVPSAFTARTLLTVERA